jgi:hypothetical protein
MARNGDGPQKISTLASDLGLEPQLLGQDVSQTWQLRS